MKLWEIFRYDLTSQLRRYRAAIYVAAVVGLTLLVATTFNDDARRDGIILNSPMVTTAIIVFVTMGGLLVTAAIAGEAATRDAQARMEPLVYTTPVAKLSYLGGRFLSAFAIMSLLVALVPLTLAATRFFPGSDPAHFGPFRLGAYLRAYLMLGVPNAFITTAILFSIVVLSRRAMTAYLGAAALFFNTMVQDEVVATALGRWDLAKLLDPFAFMIARAQWRSWTIAQRNMLPMQFDDVLLQNRLLWLGVALLALTLVYLRFRMTHYATASRWRWRKRAADATEVAGKPWSAIIATSRGRGTFSRATRARQLVTIALHSFREMITSRAALIVPLTALLLLKITPELMEVAMDTPARPTTGRIAMLFSRFSAVGIFIGAMIAFFAGQLVWRERDAREHDIADVTPVPDALSLAGKFGGLVLLLVTLQAVLMGTGIVTQISLDYENFEPALYLQFFFGFKLVDYLIFAAVAMAIQVIVNQKYLATAISMLLWIYADYAGSLGVEHKLLVFTGDSGIRYSDLSGFGASVGPWLWFKLYWIGFALLCALLARLFWVRGHEGEMKRRIALARSRFTRVHAVLAAAAVALIVGAGGYVFYNTNVLNDYMPDEHVAKLSADYERKYGQYAGIAQPVIAATKLHVELHPDQNRADVRGTYRLENRSGRAIDAIHLVTHRNYATTGVTFDRPARATITDDHLGYRVYALARALAPGESLRMDFNVRVAPRGFTNRGISAAVTGNGTLLENRPDDSARTWMPAVGYRRAVELDNPYDRRMHGLRPRAPLGALDNVAARNVETGLERIDLETVVGTAADQTAIAPGALRRSWTTGDRRYFHYVTDAPIRNGFAILSARYAVHRARWNDVEIEVLHHPAHAFNAPRFAKAAQASLEYFSREFGPYPHRQLRFIEFPNSGGNRMTSHPGTIVWAESFGLAEPEKDWREIDFLFAVVAHEVAHQWWGNQVVPARVEGAPLLSESLAWYSAMMVVEETFGREHFDRFMRTMRRSYLTPHETPEVPLLRANDWLAVYRTGALAMYALREAIGEERVNSALRALVVEHGAGKPPFPTSLDLYSRLRAVTPPANQQLLKDLFEEVTFWDLRMKALATQGAANGTHRVSLDIEAYKLKVAAGGRESRVPMNDIIEIAVFDEKDNELYRQPHRIRSGRQRITVTVPRAPFSAGIDASSKLLDRDREDNVKLIGSEATSL